MNFAALVAALEAMRNAMDDALSAIEEIHSDSQNVAAAQEQLAVFDEALAQIKAYGPAAR